MCKEFRMLVEQTDCRYVAQCEHNTVHLRWDNLAFSFQPEAFLKLGSQIIREHGLVARMFPSAPASSSTTSKTQSHLLLRVNTVKLEFPSSALPELLIVLRIACALLERPAATLPVARRRMLPNAPLAIQPCPKQSILSVMDYLN